MHLIRGNHNAVHLAVAAAEIFAFGDDDSQIGWVVGKEPLVFQSVLAYEIVVSKPQFQV